MVEQELGFLMLVIAELSTENFEFRACERTATVAAASIARAFRLHLVESGVPVAEAKEWTPSKVEDYYGIKVWTAHPGVTLRDHEKFPPT